MTPDDPRHGENRGYAAGCREDCCLHAHMIYMKRYRLGTARKVSALGLIRRSQALEAIGWSLADQSRALGRERSHVGLVLSKDTVYASTAEAFAAMYERYSMVVPIDIEDRGHGVNRVHDRTRRRAAAKGYAPPLAWDDIDDPNEQPESGAYRPVAARPNDELLDEWDHLRSLGVSIHQAARQLGVTIDAIQTAVRRRERSAA